MKETITRLLFAALLACLVLPDVASGQQVSGTVSDSTDGSPLPGVNIVVKGTTQGTASSVDGSYELAVPSLSDTLVFSFVGYQQKEVPIAGQTEIDVALASQALIGEELVVVGYGTQERQQITGSVSSVSEADFVTGNVNSPTDLIQGKVPGLQITSRSGNPNDNAEIRLRSISSFGANQEPLVVVDGIIGASIENVDPNDVASIDVLKDASAAAIYGTRGSAGVIVLTTKSGGNRELSVDYNGYYTFEGIENRLNVLTASQFRELSEMTGFDIRDDGNSTRWFEEISQSGSNFVHNLALSGGTEDLTFRVSGNYRKREGIQEHTGFDQIGGRINFSQWALDSKLKITALMSATNKQQNFGFTDAFKFAGIMNPTSPVRADGFENTGGFVEAPLFNYFNPANIIEEGTRQGETTLFNGALRADYDFSALIPNLSASVFYSLQTEDEKSRNFYSREHKMLGGATQASRGPGRAEQFLLETRNQLFETTVSHTGNVSDLNIETIAGYSWNDFVDEGFNAGGGEFIADNVGFNNLSFAQDFDQGEGSVSSFKSTNRIVGFFGRANLNYDNTFFLNGSLRREGSSRFGENNKFGTFWAAGLGVEVTNLVDISFLNSLRVRGSIGKTGQDAPENGLAVQRFAPQGNFFVNGQFIQSFGPVSNPNPDLKWEEKTEINLGVDFEAMQSRLSGTVEAYNSVTSDLLFEVGVPVPPNLFPTTWQNVGELETSGLELTLNYAAFQGGSDGFNWNTTFTGALYSETTLNEFTSDEVRFLSNPGSPGLNTPSLVRIKQGEPIGQLWGPEFSRIGDDGQWLFIDADGQEVEFGDLTPDDRKILGNGLPDYQLGWTNQLRYKNLDFSVFIEGVFGHQLANMFSLFYTAPKQITSYNVLEDAFDLAELTDDPRWSSYYVEDADYIRIQNASLGYTFDLNRIGAVNQLRVYASGNNLYTFTGYSGVNPQVRYEDENLGQSETGDTGGALAPGIERRIEWYTARSISLGVDLSF